MNLQAQVKERVKRIKETPKDCQKEPRVRTKVPKAHAKVKHWKRNDGWTFDGWNDDDGNGVEWREDCEQTHVTSASSFSLESSEWDTMNLDTRVAVNTSNFDREDVGDGSFHDWIPDGETWQFQGYDENCFLRSLDGRLMNACEVLNGIALAPSSRAIPELTGVPKVLDIAAKIACKEQQDFYVKHNGGYTIPIHSKIGQGMRIHLEKLLDEYGRNDLIPVCLENDTPHFYLNREVNSDENHSVRDAEQNFEKESQQSGNGCGRAHRL